MARVTVEDCIQIVPNRFDLVVMAAQRAKQISRIRNRQRRHASIFGQSRHLLDMQSPLSQRISRMGPKMNEGRKA